MVSPRIAIAALTSALGFAHAAGLPPPQPSPLAQRPLVLPTLRTGEPCPISMGRQDVVPLQPHIFGAGGFWFGRGPVFVGLFWKEALESRAVFELAPVSRVRNTYSAKTGWVSEPSYAGPILIRGRALDAETPLEFGASSSEQKPDLQLVAPNVREPDLWSFWPSSMWITGPSCYGIQIDTTSGTEVVVFRAR